MRRLRQNVENLQMHIIEYRYRPDFRSPMTEWKEHHVAGTVEDAELELRHLERMDRKDRADGLVAWWEKTEYRIVPEH